MAESASTASSKSPTDEPRRRAPRRTTPRKPQQERGRARYETILNVLESLLAETDWDQIGYYQIVERARMPAASIYHFFPSRDALVAALADRYFEHFTREAERFTANCDFPRWQDFVAAGHRISVEFYNSHPASMKLILGSQPFMEIRKSDSSVNRIVTDQTVEAFRRMYELPYIQDPHRKFLIVLAIGDAVWRTSLDEHGYITPVYEEEATRAVIAYFRTFLPEDLEPKQEAASSQ
ncbi:MAG: transcriptional regulator, TetR family [Caulobacteraceae bacterium]|jgi:AcrR family transcriptional regulator|nr:transcriptional regulator, TetR family [Caulobacteraceae bacterium]